MAYSVVVYQSLIVSDSLCSYGLPHKRHLSFSTSHSLIKFMCFESVIPSSSAHFFCLQSFPESGSFLWFFTPGGQSIGASASASVLPMNIQGWFSFMINWFDLLAVQGTLRCILQHHNSKASILWHSAFFMVQLLHLYITTNKTIALTI